MATYFVDGENGDDGDSGSSWGAAKLTLNGAEDIPVAPGDLVILGPPGHVFREELTIDVSGSSGDPITYEGDWTGASTTGGPGGVIRITGSEDDISTCRTNCINGTFSGKSYRTFRGLRFDLATDQTILASGSSWIIEDCSFGEANTRHIYFWGASQFGCTVRRCFFVGLGAFKANVHSFAGALVDNANHTIENNVFTGYTSQFRSDRVGDITLKNNLFYGAYIALNLATAISASSTITVENSIVSSGNNGFNAPASTGSLLEDYNAVHSMSTARTNVTTGSNSNTYPSLGALPKLLDGYQLPAYFGELSEWSQIAAIAGNDEATDDLFGFTRPATSAKKSWGPIQYSDIERETSVIRSGCVSLKLNDAGLQQVFVPTDGTSASFNVYVNRATNYGGSTCPQMIIRQPGQADVTVTDTGAASTWNLISGSLAVSASTDFVAVLFKSHNTAASSGSAVATYFDDFSLTI